MPTKLTFSTNPSTPNATHHLIFYICGNPGLIGYYQTFLSTLHQLLTNDPRLTAGSHVFHIYGQNHAGFEDDDLPPASTGSPYLVKDQIEIMLQTLRDLRIPSGPRKGEPYDDVILMAHSLGTYIAMEMIQRARDVSLSLNIRAGILLCPTVMALRESKSGMRTGPLRFIPGFARAVGLLANVLFWPFTYAALASVLGYVLGMPKEGASVTARFLKSRMGVWQALHMAKDEFEVITVDKWDDEIWGIEKKSGSGTQVPKLFFYFAEEDHWIGNHTRDQLFSLRGKKAGDDSSSRPVMEIDTNGINHSFCIGHSEIVAEKVKNWIDSVFD